MIQGDPDQFRAVIAAQEARYSGLAERPAPTDNSVVLVIERRTLINVVNAAPRKEPPVAAVRPSKQRDDVVIVRVGRVQNPDFHEPVNAVGRPLSQSVKSGFVMEVRRREIAAGTPAHPVQRAERVGQSQNGVCIQRGKAIIRRAFGR